MSLLLLPAILVQPHPSGCSRHGIRPAHTCMDTGHAYFCVLYIIECTFHVQRTGLLCVYMLHDRACYITKVRYCVHVVKHKYTFTVRGQPYKSGSILSLQQTRKACSNNDPSPLRTPTTYTQLGFGLGGMCARVFVGSRAG